MSICIQVVHFTQLNNCKRYTFMVCFFISLIFLESCSTSSFNDKINQGNVTFDIIYANNSGRSFPIQLLPKTIEMKFNNNFASYTIEDRVGLFSISNIIDLNKHENITLIKVFDKKYVYRGGKNDSPIFFKNGIPYEVKFLSDTQRLAGILCKKASMLDTETNKSFDILYANNIQIQDINKNTPYERVKGLLLQFGIQMKNLTMKLTAKKIEQKEIKDQEFAIPDGYKYISKTQMEEIINTLLP